MLDIWCNSRYVAIYISTHWGPMCWSDYDYRSLGPEVEPDGSENLQTFERVGVGPESPKLNRFQASLTLGYICASLIKALPNWLQSEARAPIRRISYPNFRVGWLTVSVISWTHRHILEIPTHWDKIMTNISHTHSSPNSFLSYPSDSIWFDSTRLVWDCWCLRPSMFEINSSRQKK